MTYFPLHQTTCFFIPLVAPCKPLLTRYDEQLRDSITNNTNAQELLLNIYRVMLTRAKKGLCIWFEDAETKKHFKEVCLLEE